MKDITKIELDGFYPESLKITKVSESDKQIIIQLKSQKHSHKCHKCEKEFIRPLMENHTDIRQRGSVSPMSV